jgi:hypothetical protein
MMKLLGYLAIWQAAFALTLPAAAQVPPIQPPPGLAANAANATLPAALNNLGLGTANSPTFAGLILGGKASLLTNPSSTGIGNVSGLRIGIAAGTESSWATSPAAGDFVAFYPYINSSNGRTSIWSINPIVDVFNGADATATTAEFDMNNAATEVSTPNTTLQKTIVSAVSGGIHKSTTGFTSTASLPDGSNWSYNGYLAQRNVNYGFWAHQISGDSVNPFAQAAFYDDSNSATIFKAVGTHTSGLDFTGATISGNPFASNAFSVNNQGGGEFGAGTAIDTKTAVASTNASIYSVANTAGAYPPSATTSFAITDHFASQREVDFFNNDTLAPTSFSFYQKTSASTATLLASISPTGNLGVAGDVDDRGIAPTGTAGSGYVRATSPTLTTPTIAGGTATGLTGLAIRDTSAAFDVTLAGTSSTALSAGRTLTLDMKNVAHTLALSATANTITFPNTASYTVIGSGDTGTVTNTMLAGSIAASKLVASDITTVGTLTAGSINWAGNIATSGTLLHKALTVSKTGAYPVVAGDAGTHFDNIGAAGSVTFTLPAAAPGLNYCFLVSAAQTVVVAAASGEKVAIGLTNSAASGNITATAAFSQACIEAHAASQWVARSVTGTWTVN